MSTSVDDETILDVLRSNDAPRMTTTEVAEHLPVTRGTTRTRLQRLADDDLLERTTEGNNVVWWLPEREDELDAWEEAQAAEAESNDADEEADEEAIDEEAGEADEEEGSDDDAIEVEAVDAEPDEIDESDEADTGEADAESDEDATTVEVEAVSDDDGEPTTTTDDELPELSDDDEGLRAVAAVAVGIVAVIVLRRLLGGD